MEITRIIAEIKKERPDAKAVFFVGCGASKAELYPAKYFLEEKAKMLRASLYTANEFVHATPAAVNETALLLHAPWAATRRRQWKPPRRLWNQAQR